MEMNSVLLKCPQGEGQPACRAPGGQSPSSSSPAQPLQFYLLIATHYWERRLPEKCHSSVQSRTAVAHPAWANSCSPGAGKGSRGDEETDAPLPTCSIWFFLFFPRAACPPLSFPSCPVGRSTAANCSLCSVASPQWWWFCSSWQHSIIPLVPTSAWKAGATGFGLFQARSSASKEEPEGLFVYLLVVFLSCSFHFVPSTGRHSCCFPTVEYQRVTEMPAVK